MASSLFNIDLPKILGNSLGKLLLDCVLKVDKNQSALSNANDDLTKSVPDFVDYNVNGVITPDTKGMFLDPNHYGTIELLNVPEGVSINKFDIVEISGGNYEITRVMTDPARAAYRCWVRERVE